MHHLKWLYCTLLIGLLFFSACGKTPTEAPTEQVTETEAPTEQTTEHNAGTEDIGAFQKRAVDHYAGCYNDEDGALVVLIKEGGEEYEELIRKVGTGCDKVVVSYVKYSQMDLLEQKEHLTERIRNAGEEISGIITKCQVSIKMNGIFVEVNENNEEKMAKIRALADDPEAVAVTYSEGEASTEQNAATEDIGSYSKKAAQYFAGRYVDEDGALVVRIKFGGEAYEELLKKVYGSGYDKVRATYVKYSQVDINTQYAHLKERIQNAGEEISGIVKAYGTGPAGIVVQVNENNEEKMAKIRALADDPEVVTVQYVEGEPVNH